MFKVAKVGTDKFVIANFTPGKAPKPLRFGHELQRDGVGLGKVMVWKSLEAAKMYQDLLNRGILL